MHLHSFFYSSLEATIKIPYILELRSGRPSMLFYSKAILISKTSNSQNISASEKLW